MLSPWHSCWRCRKRKYKNRKICLFVYFDHVLLTSRLRTRTGLNSGLNSASVPYITLQKSVQFSISCVFSIKVGLLSTSRRKLPLADFPRDKPPPFPVNKLFFISPATSNGHTKNDGWEADDQLILLTRNADNCGWVPLSFMLLMVHIRFGLVLYFCVGTSSLVSIGMGDSSEILIVLAFNKLRTADNPWVGATSTERRYRRMRIVAQ